MYLDSASILSLASLCTNDRHLVLIAAPPNFARLRSDVGTFHWVGDNRALALSNTFLRHLRLLCCLRPFYYTTESNRRRALLPCYSTHLRDKVPAARLLSLPIHAPRLRAPSTPNIVVSRRLTSSMASESLNSSRGELQDQNQQSSSANTIPHAARGAAATPSPMAWFPLGYKEGFSQWV